MKKQRKSRVGGLGPPLGGVLGPSWPLGSAKSRKSKLFPPHPPPVFDRQKLPERSFLLFFRVSAFSCFLVFFRLDFNRLLDTLKSQICCACHVFFMFFMFRKSLHFGWLLAFQKQPQTSIFHVFGPLVFSWFSVFSTFAFFKNMKNAPYMWSKWRVSLFNDFVKSLDFLVFSRYRFFEGPELTFFDFGRSRGRPKLTPTFQK